MTIAKPYLPALSAATHLVAGTHLPALALPATSGGHVGFCGPGRAIIFVYPYTGRPGVADPPGWDDIPGAHGSTPEAHGFRDHHAAFAARGIAIYGLSGQSPEWQSEFAARAGLPFALLSDEQFRLADALRLPRFQAGAGIYLDRLTLFVGDGLVVATTHPVMDPAGHAAWVLQNLPAGW